MSDKLNLLSGTAVKTEDGYFYIKNHTRLRIPSRRVLNSWNFHRVVKANESQVAHYKVMGKLGFRDGTFILCIADFRCYLISGNKRVHVTDPQTIKDHGYKSWMDALVVSAADRDLHSLKEASV